LKPIHWLILLVAVRFALPFLLQDNFYEPHRDAYLYLDYAHHLDWGYMEVPPLLSVFSWLALKLGNGMFWVKCWPALFGAFTFGLCGHLVLLLGGKTRALFLLFICFVFGAFLRVFFLFQPGFLEIFYWTAIAYSFIRFQMHPSKKWLLLFGICCGLGVISKYTTLFFLSGILVGLILTKERKIFLNPLLYISAGVAILMFLPNLYWQYNHRFPVIYHMKELRETQLVYLGTTDFLAGQFMMNFIVLFVWLSGLITLLFTMKWAKFRWYGFGYLTVLVLFILGSGKDYYTLGLYPILFAFGAVSIEQWSRKWHPVLKPLPLVLPTILGIFIIPLILPINKPEKLAAYFVKTGIKEAMGFKWEDQQNHPLPQDYADMFGWKSLTEMVAKNFHSLPDSVQKETIIYCRGYYSAGALNFFGPELNLPTAISDNGSYLWWIPSPLKFKHLMLISHSDPEPDDEVFNQFEKRILMDSLQLPLFRETGMKVRFFQNGNDSLSYYFTQSLETQKDVFRRLP